MKTFEELGIEKEILEAIKQKGFENPTDIQEQTIPLVIEGKDVVGGAATGSGKTLAFGAGMIQKAQRNRGIQGLVLTPTRELAEQVKKELSYFSKKKGLRVTAVYGGVSINPQMTRLETAEIVVGTPGRVLDHMGRNTIDLSNVNVLVLDEADRMADMGFIDDVKRIISGCPKDRQTLLFSATITDDIYWITKNHMKDPVKISVESYVDPKKLKQIYYDVDDKGKFALLVHLLKEEKEGLVMVFCNTQKNTDFVARNLKALGINALAIHGGFTQAKRNKTMEDFHNKNVNVLVCTDVAARGLDIKGVSHVYNYDIPKESKQYIHRVGRTARAGSEGIAINVLSSRDHDNFSRVLRDNEMDIPKETTPEFSRVKIHYKDSPRGRGGFRGHASRGQRSRNKKPHWARKSKPRYKRR